MKKLNILHRSVNKMLSNFANSEKKLDWPPLISYTPCPFAFTPDSKFFDFDGLHFSEKGYQEFGKGICDVVHKLVKWTQARMWSRIL